MANDKPKPVPTPAATPPQEDHGFDESHGYGPGHGGPSGPGDVPAQEAPPAASPKVPTAEEDEALPSEQ